MVDRAAAAAALASWRIDELSALDHDAVAFVLPGIVMKVRTGIYSLISVGAAKSSRYDVPKSFSNHDQLIYLLTWFIFILEFLRMIAAAPLRAGCEQGRAHGGN